MMYRTFLLLIVAGVASSCASQNCGLELSRCKHDDALIKHIGYTLSYNDELLSAKWVAWELTSEEAGGQYPRDKNFYADPDWRGLQADNSDYRRSGWSRGHLAPAGDMKWSEQGTADGAYQSIGFVFKNNGDKQPLADCSMSVDDVERITGLDFYPSLPNRIERKVESAFNLKCWNL